MNLKIFFTSLVLLLWLPFSGSVLAQEPTLSEAADKLCQSYLQLIDKQQYSQTYNLITPGLRQAKTERQWGDLVKSVRESVGEIKSRRLAKVEKTETFADLPKGDYLLAVFETSFTGKAETKETVVLAFTEGGYEVAGYKISYNQWPEALRIIGNGLFVVFFIMSLLAFITWVVGKIFAKAENSNKKEEVS
ncbi:MAG: DUF4019 domain-containing protein [Deltaproteobacteria bacterium]|nr:DUF4019 domain-containing protein [Deltaproteobacteria bacterium]MBW2051003.1 DUF4019 domain-containing protein [Deltaproteobacteria bacterium]MBW2140526.1 DUF4019 domain-containing protein [Deltaproteobacteria bacterium]MBW2323654.1 DUF4019 domain-containing protein [Deltaproteobacteria bacterium]